MTLLDSLFAMVLVSLAVVACTSVCIYAQKGFTSYRRQCAVWNIETSLLTQPKYRLAEASTRHYDEHGRPSDQNAAFRLDIESQQLGPVVEFRCSIIDAENSQSVAMIVRRFWSHEL